MILSPDGTQFFGPVDTSSSELKTFDRCRVAWFIKSVLRLRSTATRPPLMIGGIIHEVLASFYEPSTDLGDRSWDLIKDLLVDNYRERLTIDLVDSDRVTWNRMAGILHAYWKTYGRDDWVLADTEVDFRIPIFLGNLLVGFVHGRFDGILIEDEIVWVVDHKTTKRLSLRHLGVDPQFNIYCLAGSKLFGKRFGGIALNYLRTKLSKRSPNFVRPRVFRTTPELYRIEQNLALRMIQMGSMSPQDLILSPRRECIWDCSYTRLCRALRQGAPLKDLMNSGFRIRPYGENR